MDYYLGRNDQQMGQFSEESLRQGLAEGRFFTTDLVWSEGMADWKPLGEVFGSGTNVVAPVGLSTEGVTSSDQAGASAASASGGSEVFPPSSFQNQVSSTPPVSYFPPVGGVPQHYNQGVMPTPGTAIASLVLGILSWVTCYLGFLFMIPGVICGHMALSAIQRSRGQMGGKGLAIAGVVLGYVWLACVVLFILFFLVVGVASNVSQH